MAKIGSTDLALVTARVKCCRLGAARLGFTPYDVKGPGATYPCEYMWREVKPPTTQWTLLTEGVVCGKRPVAGFTNVLCNAVGPVSFTDTSTPENQITFWYWDFGDGSTSNDQNPTHTYAEGFFTVTLYVSGDKGTDSVIGYVSVMSLSAGAAPNPVNVGADVTFTPTLAGGLAPFAYLWAFTYPKLFAAWNMDDAVGAVTQSSVRHDWLGNYDLTDQWAAPGTIALAAGKVGQATAYALGGDTAFSNVTITLPSSFTITGWFKTGSTLNQYLFSYGPNTLSGGVNIHVWTAVITGVRFFTDDDPGDEADSGVAITLNDWHFFAATHDGVTGENTIQVDGSVPVSKAAQPNPAATQELRLGRHQGGAGQLYGYLDAIQVWDEVLSQPEITALSGGWEPATSALAAPVIPMPIVGVTVASLTVTSASGCTIGDTVDVTVQAGTLAVTYVMDPDPLTSAVDVTDAITLTPTVTPGVAPYTYVWVFGDGTANSTDEIPIHTYNVPLDGGTYTCTVTVTDANLDVASHSETFNIGGI